MNFLKVHVTVSRYRIEKIICHHTNY